MGSVLAFLLTALAAWRVILYKAIIVQPETLFYFLYLCSFAVMLSLLRRPNWKAAAMGGIIAGVTHLTKGSALPMLALFAFCGVLRLGYSWWAGRKQSASVPPRAWSASLGAFFLTFLLVTAWFLWNTHRNYGSPFYDPNSRYYFWAESAEEMGAMQKTDLAWSKPYLNRNSIVLPEIEKWLPVWAGPEKAQRIRDRALAGRKVSLAGPYDVLPGKDNYFARHSLWDAAQRIWDGTLFMLRRNMEHRDRYGEPLLWLAGEALIAGLLLFAGREESWRSRLRRIGWPALFAAASICGCLLLYGWWASVSNRNRFFLTQYLPMLLCLGAVIHQAGKQVKWKLPVRLPFAKDGHWLAKRWEISAATLLNLAAALIVAIQLSDPRLGKLVQ
jgi:hypothetical protein